MARRRAVHAKVTLRLKGNRKCMFQGENSLWVATPWMWGAHSAGSLFFYFFFLFCVFNFDC